MTKLLIGYSILALVLLLLTPIAAFSTSSVIPTLTDRQAARILEDAVSSIHIVLGTDSDTTRQFHLEKLARIIENITGYKEDITVSMVGNGLNVRIDPDPDGTSTNGDRSGLSLVQDPCSNQIGSAKMTYPYENRTDCEVEQWIECIENSGTVKWDQLHCDDLSKLFDDPRAPLPPTPPPNNITDPSKNDTGTERGIELTPTPPPTPTDYCAEGAMRPPDYDEVCTGEEENEGENEQPLVPLPEFGEDEEGDTGEDQGADTGEDEESSSDDNSEEESSQPLPQFG